MNFLGLRIEDHDSNITFTDGKKVKYCATERLFGVKHHGYDNNWQWGDVLADWGIHVNELDAICLITDKVNFAPGELYREVDIGFPCKTFVLDHHYAHALSIWPIGEVPYTNYVFDGFGNDEKSHSLFLENMLAAALTETVLGQTMGVLAVALAAVNVFGGFLVTKRMLEMFKKKEKKPAAGASAEKEAA